MFKLLRVAIFAFLAEVLAVLLLVLVVMLTGPGEQAAAQAYAERLGVWIGPIGGFLSCLFCGYWVARAEPENHVRNGAILGAAVAALDLAILFGSGAPFQVVFVVSNTGRVIAGALGGWAAGRRAPGREASAASAPA